MIRSLKGLFQNPLISGSFFLFSGGILSSFFNFLFNILMSRNLRVEEYGTLISLISIITLFSIPAGAITPTVVTLAGAYFAKSETGHLHALFTKLLKGVIFAGIVIFILFVVFSFQISSFFKIENSGLVIYIILGIIFWYLLTLSNSFLQAKLSFRFLSLTQISSTFLKVAVAVFLVFAGWGITGALIGFLVSIFSPILMSVFYLKHIIFLKSESLPKISFKSLISYGVPSAIIVFCLNSLISSDILLVKHLFNSYEAGLYAGLSLVGRVIYFVSAPIGTVMFPIIIKRLNKKQNYKKVLLLSILLVSAASIFITFFYMIFTDFSVVFFLKKTEYLAISPLLVRFSIFISLYSLVSIMSYYFLSIKKTSYSLIIAAGSILQVVLILSFHANFAQIIDISTVVCIAILAVSFLTFNYLRHD